MKRLAGWLILLCWISILSADGKLLRGERWQRFSYSTSADFYVAPDGNDEWSGTLAEPNAQGTDGPFATLQRAQMAVRELKTSVYKPKDPPVETRWIGSPHPLGSGKDIAVVIRGGVYPLTAPLILTPMDGGERVETNLPTGAFEYHKLRDHYVTYAAWPGEKPVIAGGEPITGWTKDGTVWKTKVESPVTVLVANGRKMTLARTPNEGYFTPPKFSPNKNEFYFSPGQLKAWPDLEGNRIFMLLRWHSGVNSIAEIDEEKGLARLAEEEKGITIVPPRYYVENVKSLLDAPGEWFYEKETRLLYLIPPEGISDPNKARIIAPQLDQLIKVAGDREKPVRNLRFYGLSFEATEAGGDAVSLEYAHANEVVDCRFKSLAGTGVRVKSGCYQTRILSNRFETIDNGAIAVDGNGHPENWADIIRETTISFNRASDCGGTTIYAYNTLYTTISRNEITDNRGRYAISVGGWRNLEEAIDGGYRVEYNHCHNVQKLADDSGVIKTAGLTTDSIIRGNLVHDVHAGYFNDNVGFWFDNMSSGWLTERNIYYNLEQGEMKLCAANLVDNIYRDNFVIEPPQVEPEGIIEGEPDFRFGEIEIENHDRPEGFKTGDNVKVSVSIFNAGSSGVQSVPVFWNGRIVEERLFPVIKNNSRIFEFERRLTAPGEVRVAVGSSQEIRFSVSGEKLNLIVSNFKIDQHIVPEGDSLACSATVANLTDSEGDFEIALLLDDQPVQSKVIKLNPGESVPVSFSLLPEAGEYTVRLGNSRPEKVKVYRHKKVDIASAPFKTHVSGRAYNSKVSFDAQKNRFRIEATGSDFFHAEDSYAAVFLKGVKGNFVATVKVLGFGERTHEWFRAGLFARNALDQSFDTAPGSKGSVLYFTTPGRAGIQWDQFGDGCMHKAASENLAEDVKFPVWLKLVRHGDSFSGWLSYDGTSWTIERHTTPVPGLAESIDVGLAAGSCDERPYWVEFADFQLLVEEK